MTFISEPDSHGVVKNDSDRPMDNVMLIDRV